MRLRARFEILLSIIIITITLTLPSWSHLRLERNEFGAVHASLRLTCPIKLHRPGAGAKAALSRTSLELLYLGGPGVGRLSIGGTTGMASEYMVDQDELGGTYLRVADYLNRPVLAHCFPVRQLRSAAGAVGVVIAQSAVGVCSCRNPALPVRVQLCL
jgi:hypothetical protein